MTEEQWERAMCGFIIREGLANARAKYGELEKEIKRTEKIIKIAENRGLGLTASGDLESADVVYEGVEERNVELEKLKIRLFFLEKVIRRCGM